LTTKIPITSDSWIGFFQFHGRGHGELRLFITKSPQSTTSGAKKTIIAGKNIRKNQPIDAQRRSTTTFHRTLQQQPADRLQTQNA